MVTYIGVNLLAVLLAAVAANLLGMLWYSPLLFGKKWMGLSGLTDKKLQEAKKKGMAKNYFIGFVSTLVMAFVLSVVLSTVDVKTYSELFCFFNRTQI